MLEKRIQDIRISLEKDTLNVLSWIIADSVVDIRFDVPREMSYPGNYHDKVGVFTDENSDLVAIHISLNDSIRGSWNGEAFSVFKSWDECQQPYLQKHKTRLELLWNDENPFFRVHHIPESVLEQIVKLRSTIHRPYFPPTSPVTVTTPSKL